MKDNKIEVGVIVKDDTSTGIKSIADSLKGVTGDLSKVDDIFSNLGKYASDAAQKIINLSKSAGNYAGILDKIQQTDLTIDPNGGVSKFNTTLDSVTNSLNDIISSSKSLNVELSDDSKTKSFSSLNDELNNTHRNVAALKRSDVKIPIKADLNRTDIAAAKTELSALTNVPFIIPLTINERAIEDVDEIYDTIDELAGAPWPVKIEPSANTKVLDEINEFIVDLSNKKHIVEVETVTSGLDKVYDITNVVKELDDNINNLSIDIDVNTDSVKDAKQSVQDLNDNTKDINVKVNVDDKSVSKIRSVSDKLYTMKRSITSMITPFAYFAGSITAAVVASNALLKSTIEYDKSLKQIAETSEWTARGISGVHDEVKRLQRAYGIAARDATASMRAMALSGISTSDIDRLGKAVKATGIEINQLRDRAIDISVTYNSNFGEILDEIARLGEKSIDINSTINNIDHTMNTLDDLTISITEYTDALLLAEKAGIPMERTQRALYSILDAAADPASRLNRAIRDSKTEWNDFTDVLLAHGGDVTKTIVTLIDALESYTPPEFDTNNIDALISKSDNLYQLFYKISGITIDEAIKSPTKLTQAISEINKHLSLTPEEIDRIIKGLNLLAEASSEEYRLEMVFYEDEESERKIRKKIESLKEEGKHLLKNLPITFDESTYIKDIDKLKSIKEIKLTNPEDVRRLSYAVDTLAGTTDIAREFERIMNKTLIEAIIKGEDWRTVLEQTIDTVKANNTGFTGLFDDKSVKHYANALLEVSNRLDDIQQEVDLDKLAAGFEAPKTKAEELSDSIDRLWFSLGNLKTTILYELVPTLEQLARGFEVITGLLELHFEFTTKGASKEDIDKLISNLPNTIIKEILVKYEFSSNLFDIQNKMNETHAKQQREIDSFTNESRNWLNAIFNIRASADVIELPDIEIEEIKPIEVEIPIIQEKEIKLESVEAIIDIQADPTIILSDTLTLDHEINIEAIETTVTINTTPIIEFDSNITLNEDVYFDDIEADVYIKTTPIIEFDNNIKLDSDINIEAIEADVIIKTDPVIILDKNITLDEDINIEAIDTTITIKADTYVEFDKDIKIDDDIHIDALEGTVTIITSPDVQFDNNIKIKDDVNIDALDATVTVRTEPLIEFDQNVRITDDVNIESLSGTVIVKAEPIIEFESDITIDSKVNIKPIKTDVPIQITPIIEIPTDIQLNINQLTEIENKVLNNIIIESTIPIVITPDIIVDIQETIVDMDVSIKPTILNQTVKIPAETVKSIETSIKTQFDKTVKPSVTIEPVFDVIISEGLDITLDNLNLTFTEQDKIIYKLQDTIDRYASRIKTMCKDSVIQVNQLTDSFSNLNDKINYVLKSVKDLNVNTQLTTVTPTLSGVQPPAKDKPIVQHIDQSVKVQTMYVNSEKAPLVKPVFSGAW